jgi:hypothetical protein
MKHFYKLKFLFIILFILQMIKSKVNKAQEAE